MCLPFLWSAYQHTACLSEATNICLVSCASLPVKHKEQTEVAIQPKRNSNVIREQLLKSSTFQLEVCRVITWTDSFVTFAVCSIVTTTLLPPLATRSIAPPIPLTNLPCQKWDKTLNFWPLVCKYQLASNSTLTGIIQLARSPFLETCIAPSIVKCTWPLQKKRNKTLDFHQNHVNRRKCNAAKKTHFALIGVGQL